VIIEVVDVTDIQENPKCTAKPKTYNKYSLKTSGILVQGPESEIIENNKAACELLELQTTALKTSTKIGW
jgi:hypothetical protein